MRILFGLLVLAHGVAHLVGFAGPWGLVREIPRSTTLFAGHIDVGDGGAKVIGIVWLLVALAFGVVAVGVRLQASWWPWAAVAMAAVSLVLCILGWPHATIGLAVNLLIVAAALVVLQPGWELPRR